MKKIIENSFIQKFNHKPTKTFFAPGRANIIGEHTDYNEGFVLPFAIQYGIWFAFSANSSGIYNVFSHNENDFLTISEDNIHLDQSGWKKFITQVLLNIKNSWQHGGDIVFGGNLPIGAGISSSSALTCGAVTTFSFIIHNRLDAQYILDTAVLAERGYGVQGGIMDQYTIINAAQGNAILLDCRDNLVESIALPSEKCHFYLINTHVKHHLVDTEYNQRRKECHEAVAFIQKYQPNVKSLRDATFHDVDLLKLYPKIHSRAQFVIEENIRVQNAVKALKDHNIKFLGELLYQSHAGLSQLYEVSCEELDSLVNISHDIPEIIGSRMMGGGFGGCTINLTNEPLTAKSCKKIETAYFEKFSTKPEIFEVQPENGIMLSF